MTLFSPAARVLISVLLVYFCVPLDVFNFNYTYSLRIPPVLSHSLGINICLEVYNIWTRVEDFGRRLFQSSDISLHRN